MPSWKKLTDKQWARQVILHAQHTARLHVKGKDKKGDRAASRMAKVIVLHTTSNEQRNSLKELFKAAYEEAWHKAQT